MQLFIFILLLFVLHIQEPFNAEPPVSELVASYITSVDMFYKRNHGPVPVLANYSTYVSVSVNILFVVSCSLVEIIIKISCL